MASRSTATARACVSPRFLSERQVSEILGLSVRTIQDWRLRRRGPPWRKIGRAIRYDTAALDDWLALQPGGGGYR